MDNHQLELILKEIRCKPERYAVVASDELESTIIPPGHFRICNLDVISGDGWHWVLFYSTRRRINQLPERYDTLLYYFDSLGECSETYGNMRNFICSYDLLVTNEGFNVQFVDQPSTTCGAHCLYVASKLCTGKYTLEDVMQKYRLGTTLDDVQFNECLATQYVCKRFAKYSKIFDRLKGC